MKALVVLSVLLLLQFGVYGKYIWEISRNEVDAREAEAIREEKRSKTSIIN